MALYTIAYKQSVLKDIRKIPDVFLKKIESAIGNLALNPTPPGAKSIQGYPHHYRIRIGMYRVVYELEKVIKIVTIVKIGHRKGWVAGV